MIDEKVIICSCIKNVGKYLDKSLELCIETGKLFKNYKVIIYENNSTDNTKEILNKYKDNSNFKIISEDIPFEIIKKNSKCWRYTKITGDDFPCRTEQISNAKNIIINEFLNNNEYNDYNYIIFIDIDTNYWDLNGIINSFERKDEWDAIFANGIKQDGCYYDYYAYRNNDTIYNLFGPEILGDQACYINHLREMYIPKDKNELIPVLSAFGGIGIYKKQLFQEDSSIKYTTFITNDLIILYINLLTNNNFDDNLLKLIENPCEKFAGGKEVFYNKNNKQHKIYLKNNCGYDNIVICEHVSINISLYLKGKKLMINPKMIYHWTY